MAIELDLTGRRVLITGASKGIGEGLAHAFAGEGAHLHLAARSADRLSELRDTIVKTHGVEVGVTAADLGTLEGVEKTVADAGDLDVVVNNAGAIPSGTLFDVDADAWQTGWELKVFGYVNVSRLVYPRLKARGGGVIINNIGNGGEISDPAYIAGASGNASLMAFTRALGGRSLDDGIRVVGVNPGPVDTDRIYTMLKKRAKALYDDENRYTELVELYPRGRPAHIRELTDLILFLASERAGYISGTVVTVDGGIASRQSIV